MDYVLKENQDATMQEAVFMNSQCATVCSSNFNSLFFISIYYVAIYIQNVKNQIKELYYIIFRAKTNIPNIRILKIRS